MDFDFIVIGSGFGGSVAAHRLTEKGYRVAVMEMGRRWTPENLPTTNWQIWRWIWRPGLALRGFFNIEPFRHVMIMHGCAVGGGSITYANTCWSPATRSGTAARGPVWRTGKPRCRAHYETALRMLGVDGEPHSGPGRPHPPAARRKRPASATPSTAPGSPSSKRRKAKPPGQTYPDPYFGGEGPERATCIGCGGCMMGCRYNAKNTLDKNYLYLAEKARRPASSPKPGGGCRPLDGSSDGSKGYEVLHGPLHRHARQPPPLHLPRRGIRRLGAGHHGPAVPPEAKRAPCPRISDATGQPRAHQCRIADRGARARQPRGSLARASPSAPASTSTNTPTSRPRATRPAPTPWGCWPPLLTGGTPRPHAHPALARDLAASLLRHPIRTVRSLHPFGWARESLILLCMQTLDGHIDMRLGRPWFWPFRRVLMSHGQRIPTFIPQANEFARKMAQADRRHAHEHGHGDPLRRARHGAHSGRLPDGRVAGRWRGGFAGTASSATGTCTSATAR